MGSFEPEEEIVLKLRLVSSFWVRFERDKSANWPG